MMAINSPIKGDGFPDEEFFTDTQVDFSASFEDALILEKYEVASRQLDDFKGKYGETASYLHRIGRLREKQGKIKEAYEMYKRLYYEAPVFMRDKNELESVKRNIIYETINKAKAQWNQIVARASRFMEENPENHGRDNSQPYVKIFWEKHLAEIEAVAGSFLSILNLEENELSAISGLVQCYSELNLKEKSSFYRIRATEAKKYWKEMVQKRSASVLHAAQKQEDSNNYENVIAVVNLGLETDPTNSELLVIKADSLQKLGFFQEALSCVYVVLRLKPNDSKANRLKKSIEGQQFEYNLKQGMEYLIRAEQEKPGSTIQNSRIDSALSFFLDALAFDTQNLSALAGVYRCHIRTGQPLKAQKTLERIREIDSSFDVYSIFRDKNEKKSESGGCFVATRLYGEIHPVTQTLRAFRSNVLASFFVGRVLIKFYRRLGPAFAELPGRSPLYGIFRVGIEKFVSLLEK